MAAEVSFYFDVISPYSWLALLQAPGFAREHDVRFDMRPVVYAKLLDHFELVGPAEVEAKRRYTFHDVARCAREIGARLQGPPAHPFRSLEALRTATVFRGHERALDLCVALADAAWGQGRDVTDVAVLQRVVAEIGLDAHGLDARIRDDAVKRELTALTSGAIQAGVFGVPSFLVAGELFWGHDRMPQLARRLAGTLPAPRGDADRILARPAGARRRRE